MNWLRVKYTLKIIVTPGCWLRLGKLDLAWDKELWEIIERGEVFNHPRRSEHVALLRDGREVWIANHPYASGSLRGAAFNDLGQCRRATALFLHDHLKGSKIFDKLRA